jgi:penicillin-binding protein 2
MLNAPRNSVFNDHERSEELIAAGSPWRLWLIGMSFFLFAVAVLLRVAWVQSQLPDEYLKALSATTIEEQLIPARDGRILAESIVLASDIEQMSLEVHFRWLQESADENWLSRQIRQRLTRDERRNPELVQKTEQDILNRRAAMIAELCQVTETSLEELQARFADIESNVRRISDSVNRRHLNLKSFDSSAEVDPDEESDPQGLLFGLVSSVRKTLTTPPSREDADRIVVREEESWHAVLNDIPRNAAAFISEHPERFPGVRIVESTVRTYPERDLAVHVVGARTTPPEDSEVALPFNTPSSRVGRSGVERSWDRVLSGVPGLRRTIRDHRQRIISSEVVRKPVSGRDVTLTLDPELQRLAEQLLAESLGDAERQLLPRSVESVNSDSSESAGPPEPEYIPTGGCALVMEADSGRLIAAASAPKFDLTLFTEGTRTQWEAINSDVRRPFIARFTGMALPPGSTFKIVTALAGLHSGDLSQSSPFQCQGYLHDPDEHRCLIYRLHGSGHGSVNLKTAMAQSCNVYFFDAAQRMGIQPLSLWAEKLEFGRPTGIDLPFEKPGTLPVAGMSRQTELSESARRRLKREALGLAIGQSRLTVTPIQMARLLALVANDGWLVTPHVVSDEGTARSADEINDSPYRLTRKRVPGLDADLLTAIHDGLVAAVEEPIGTAYRTVRLPGIRTAGKTGTAETSPGKPDHAWFTGYAPADNPQYVIVVVLEHGGSGSRAAGPIARELVRGLSSRGLLQNIELSQQNIRH